MCLFLGNRPEVFRDKDKSDDICNFSQTVQKKNVYVCVTERNKECNKISVVG